MTITRPIARAVIFDMDGVLVDSEPLHEQAFLRVLDTLGYANRHGIHFPDYYGRSDQALWKDFVAKHQPEQSLHELLALKRREFFDLVRATEPIFPSIPTLVSNLARHVPLAVASGSAHEVIQVVLGMKNLRPNFQAIVSAEDVPNGKPAPDVFLRAASLLGVPPEDCWVIEDSVAGVEAARRAGMSVIGITNTVTATQLAHATHVVENYQQIADILAPQIAPQ